MSSKAVKAGEAYVEATLQDGKLRAGLRKISGTMKSLGTKMLGVGVAMGAAFLPAIQAAGRMSAVLASFDTIFKSSSKEMGKWGDSLAKTLGRAKTDVRDYMTQTQGRLLAAGVDQPAANDINKQLTERAFDLAAFWDKDDATAFQAMQNALTGEMEMLKQFGIVIAQADVDAKLKAMGLHPSQASQAEKVQARFALLLERSAEQMGTASRESGEYGSQVKRLQAELQSVAESVGMAVLPSIVKLMQAVSPLISKFSEWAQANPKVVQSVAGIAAALAGAGGLAWAIGAAIAVLSGPVGIIALIAALVVGLGSAASAFGVFGTSAAEAARQESLFQAQLKQRSALLSDKHKKANEEALAAGPGATTARLEQLTKEEARLTEQIDAETLRWERMRQDAGTFITPGERGELDVQKDFIEGLGVSRTEVGAARAALDAAKQFAPAPEETIERRFGDTEAGYQMQETSLQSQMDRAADKAFFENKRNGVYDQAAPAVDAAMSLSSAGTFSGRGAGYLGSASNPVVQKLEDISKYLTRIEKNTREGGPTFG